MYRETLTDRIMDSFPLFLLVMFGGIGSFAALAAMAVSYGPVRSTCLARGEKMEISVEWGLWTGCMVDVGGQFLPWSEVVPVKQADGRIAFEPKPYVRLSAPKSE